MEPHSNRLADASSPYLRQHADNPVDWYPWGREALDRARAEERPIFVSIGYSACHWCHVMERESFSDPDTAALLNRLFVCVKVDREERPDLDAVYMAAVQAMTGSGGWPLTAFLTPSGEPFFAGTYFPPERRWGRPSLREVATSVASAWAERRSEVSEAARELVARLATGARSAGHATLDAAALRAASLARAAREFDSVHGGFGGAPKFPSPSRLFLLLTEARHDAQARRMLTATLDGMAAGGMADWVGGGFHRYSVDERWLVPHFEKMLYDNALLLRLYSEAGVRLGEPRWLTVAAETAEYLVREMQGPEGAFYTATDADSAGKEGLFFTWTAEEIRAALPAPHAAAVVAVCALDGDAQGNFEGGRSVLRPAAERAGVASRLGVSEAELERLLAESRGLLRSAREARPRPALDDKRLAGWNGMAIWAMAFFATTTSQPDTLEVARRAGRFLLARLHPAQPVPRSWRDGVTSGAETLEDVAWVLAAFVGLFEADADPAWLEAAIRLADGRVPRYLAADGAAFDTPDDGEPLVLRPRTPTDGATPSPIGVLASTLARLATLTGRDDLRAAAIGIVTAEAELIGRWPEACASLLDAAAATGGAPGIVTVAGDAAWPSTLALVDAARRHAPTGWPVLHSPTWPPPPKLSRLVPELVGKHPAGPERAAAYVCRDGSCLPPVEDPARLSEQLQS